MTHLEDELRALGEGLRHNPPSSLSLPESSLRRIRLRRLATGSIAGVLLISIALGGTYAVRAIRPSVPTIDPAGDGPQGPSSAILFTNVRGERAGLAVDADRGMVCYFLEELGTADSFDRVEVRKSRGPDPFALSLKPTDSEISVSADTGQCVGDVDEKAVRSITGSPRDFLLVIEGPGGSLESAPLELDHAFDDAPPDACRGTRPEFTPTFVPEGWLPRLQSGSGAGIEQDLILGHYGPDPAETHAPAAAGFIDVVASERSAALDEASKLTVLESPAALKHGEGGGYSIRFSHGGCTFLFIGGGVDKELLVRFATGLRAPGDR